jgi:hypothetical protein
MPSPADSGSQASEPVVVVARPAVEEPATTVAASEPDISPEGSEAGVPSPWFLRNYHVRGDAPPFAPGPVFADGSSQISDEPVREREDLLPDGTQRVLPDLYEAAALHSAEHFRQYLKATPPRNGAPVYVVPGSPLPARPYSAPGGRRGEVPQAMVPPPGRTPAAFASEMAALRERFSGAKLSAAQRDRLLMDSYDGFLSVLRRQEQFLLAQRMQTELDQSRGPAPYWWEIKDVRFSDEVRRNRLEARVGNQQ